MGITINLGATKMTPQQIREIRKQSGMSEAMFAQELGLDIVTSTIFQLDSRMVSPAQQVLDRLNAIKVAVESTE